MSEQQAVDIESETAVRSGGIGGRVIAAGIGLVMLVGGAGFAAAQMGDADGSPEDPVEALFEAIADEDVLGVLATLDAGERDTLTGPVEDFFGELERLEILDDSFELDGVQGIDLEFEDLTFRTEEVRDDLARVYLTGGTASFAVDTDELPIGQFLSDTLSRFGVEYRGFQESDSDTLTGDDADTFVAVRNGDDGWRISLGYTAVEAARDASGEPAPAADAGLDAIGADSPEAAVEGFLRAAADLDVAAVVARLSPGELRAVHDYWPLLVDEAGLPSAEDLGADLELTELELRSETDGDRARVFIDVIGVDIDAEDVTGGVTIADGCLELRGDLRELLDELGVEDRDEPLCPEDLQELAEEMSEEMGGMALGPGMSFDPGEMTSLPEMSVTATEVDGSWYVAPVRTFADLGIAGLRSVEREDIEALIEGIESFFGQMTGMVGGGFVPPGLTDELPGDFDEDFGGGS